MSCLSRSSKSAVAVSGFLFAVAGCSGQPSSNDCRAMTWHGKRIGPLRPPSEPRYKLHTGVRRDSDGPIPNLEEPGKVQVQFP